jgi:hypothetical protein
MARNLDRRLEALERERAPRDCGCVRFFIKRPDGTVEACGGPTCQHGRPWREIEGERIPFTIASDGPQRDDTFTFDIAAASGWGGDDGV